MLYVGSYFSDHNLILPNQAQENNNTVTTCRDNGQQSLALEADPRNTLPSGSVSFENVEGHGQVSLLRHLNDTGAVTLQQLRSDGTTQFQCLTRLPLSPSLEQSYATLIRDSNASENHLIQLVIHKAMEDTYRHDIKPDIKLPLLITRDKQSIPTLTGKHRLALTHPEASRTTKQRRLT
jgi:hypothetical protein